MHLETAEIDRYGPLFDSRPSFGDGLTVLSGPNEAGKTLYLEGLVQLLEPQISELMDPAPRVNEPPTGRVVVEHSGDHIECDGETPLSEISQIEPRHLQSVFVVQDNDLALPSDRDYYTSLIERLGDIHTTEIDAIKPALKERGRLTDERLNVSSDQSYDNAGNVRDSAKELAEEIREYTERIEAEALDELDARRLRLKRELRESRTKLQAQRDARTVADYEYLTIQLEEYRETSEKLVELDDFDRESLERLRELRGDIDRDRSDLEDLESEIGETEDDIEETTERATELQDRQTKLEGRASAVEESRDKLEAYRERHERADSVERQLSLARAATIAGLLATGAAAVAGAITGSTPAFAIAAVLLLISSIGGVVYTRSNRRLSAVETARQSALESARDAGLDVGTIEEIAPAIESFEAELEQLRTKVARTAQKQEDAEEDVADLREQKRTLESRIEDQEREFRESLDAAGVDSIDEYEARVTEREELEPDRSGAKQSLVDRFGEPEAEKLDGKIETWKHDLDELIADLDVDGIDPDSYDEETLGELEDEVERLDEKLGDLEAQLAEHDDQLASFDERARALDTQPFVDRSLGLDSRSKGGLERLASQLEDVVQTIEHDAELSRKALEVFERIETQEEQKLTDLFDPDGPASRTFEHVTGGRYTEVAYDAEDHEIVVEDREERTVEPHLLSHGTRDQLYFATRISLSQQLLGTDPGFLLLDDPFLSADPDRLRQGFETLQALADDGWQILYLTAKKEVSETMVEEFDLRHTQMEPLS